jgi:acyl-CoA reductase-like NAD-dependent aldehyde dehydrogenase
LGLLQSDERIEMASAVKLDVAVPGADRLFISGEWVEPASEDVVEVINPVDGSVLIEVAAPSIADADRAVAAARAAFDDGTWPNMPVEERVAICQKFAAAIEARGEEISRAWAIECGAPLPYAQMMAGVASGIWQHVFELAPTLQFEERRTSETGDVLIRREPVGTVLAILTYNGPVNLMGMKVFPALVAGCPVVIKPAIESQLTMHLIADCAAEAGFPDGVLSVLAGGVEVSKHLVAHEGIDMVAMTGGTAIAVDVVKNTADRLARTALELGGKSPAIIAEDADLDQVALSLVPGATTHCAQVCVALSRILAPRSRYDEIVDYLAEKWRGIKVGDPMEEGTDVGPLANARAVARTEGFVASAKADGARVVVGGGRPEGVPTGGFWFEPTLLADVDNSMEVAQEEVFGPVTCVIPYDDIDDAVRIANDSKYGLAASVYSADAEAAIAIARRIRSGTVAINIAGVCMTEPFGGVKQSGWGRECGSEGIFEFTDIKQILLTSGLGFDPTAG